MTRLRIYRHVTHRLFSALVATASTCAVLGCGAQSADEPQQITEDGATPAVDDSRIEVVAAPRGVTVIGKDGAIEPGSAEVVVTNVDSGDSARTTAKDDGSFEIELDGNVSDDYRVEAAVDGHSSDVEIAGKEAPDTSNLQCLDSTDDIPEGNTTSPECDPLWAEAQCLVADAVESAGTSCESDDDCVKLNTAPSCTDSCGRDKALSVDGAAFVEAALEDINAGVCSVFNKSGCNFIPVPCVPPDPSHADCVGGVCVLASTAD